MKVFSFDKDLVLATGAQRVMVDIHNAVKTVFDATIVGNVDYEKINKTLGIPNQEYVKMISIFMFRNSVLIVHQRNEAVFFNIINKLLFLNIKLVYVHHSILKGRKLFTWLPSHIVTISDKCIENLTNYFKIPASHITKIHNAVEDVYDPNYRRISDGIIKILYPAAIYPVKRQIELVEHLRNRLSHNIRLYFAGDGEQYNELVNLTKDDERFICLGFVNVKEVLKDMDYCMLYSKYEGLPVSLIEGCMMGKPLICNNVGGNTEIAIDRHNAFVTDSWEDLVTILNNLPSNREDKYLEMSHNCRMQYLNYFEANMFQKKYINYLSNL